MLIGLHSNTVRLYSRSKVLSKWEKHSVTKKIQLISLSVLMKIRIYLKKYMEGKNKQLQQLCKFETCCSSYSRMYV